MQKIKTSYNMRRLFSCVKKQTQANELNHSERTKAGRTASLSHYDDSFMTRFE